MLQCVSPCNMFGSVRSMFVYNTCIAVVVIVVVVLCCCCFFRWRGIRIRTFLPKLTVYVEIVTTTFRSINWWNILLRNLPLNVHLLQVPLPNHANARTARCQRCTETCKNIRRWYLSSTITW